MFKEIIVIVFSASIKKAAIQIVTSIRFKSQGLVGAHLYLCTSAKAQLMLKKDIHTSWSNICYLLDNIFFRGV